MGIARGRDAVAPTLALAGLLLAFGPAALALDPALDASQYAHTAWRIRDGFTQGPIYCLAQTADGYLWLGTGFGLVRFDGVRAVPWQPPSGQALPSNYVHSLLGARDGTLWIGTRRGLASWKDGALRQYPELSGQSVLALLEDSEATVWVAAIRPAAGTLCAIRPGAVQCQEEHENLGRRACGLYEDRGGRLWVGAVAGLWRWKPGPPKFYPLPAGPNGIRAIAEDDAGGLLIGMPGGLHRFADGKTEVAFPFPGSLRQLEPRSIRRDRDRSLWAEGDGPLVHVHEGRMDLLDRAAGLSGDQVEAITEDREGSLWVATSDGLDRLHDVAVATFAGGQGLAHRDVTSVLAARDGSVWIASPGGLQRHEHGRFPILATGGTVRDGKLAGRAPNSLFQDAGGRVWVSTLDGIGYLDGDRFVAATGVTGGNVRAIAGDARGNLWLASLQHGLLRLSNGAQVEEIPWGRLGRKDFATALVADDAKGGLWVGWYDGGVAYLQNGEIQAAFAAPDGLGEGTVNALRLDEDGTLWASTEGGLSRVKDGHVATLGRKNGLPCDAIQWAVEDDTRALWLGQPCGLARIARSELQSWAAALGSDKNSTRAVRATLLDTSDGVHSRSLPGGYTPHAARSVDGRLWFTAVEGVSIVDPSRLRRNGIPPPVHIEQLVADRKAYDPASSADGGLRLPPLVRDLEIDYTALSLVAPEKVLFRYKLEGRDRDWQDAGNRRQAFYGDLGPGRYRFRVIACNNSGVWNEAGAFLDFSVAPAYYQTAWFSATCVAALLALVAALHRFRLQQVTRRVRARMEGRLEERERIARDLHDTLLQSVQGLIFKFDAIGKKTSEEQIRRAIAETLDRADEVLAEARDRVRTLRGDAEAVSDLPAAFQRIAQEAGREGGPTFKSVVEGRARELNPVVLEEAFSVGREAVLNALAHSGGRHVEVEITYDPRQFRLRVRDDGRGIAPQILEQGGRADHWGLQGMRERARRIGASLEFWCRPGAGTEVELRVPAAAAYRGRT